MAEDVYDPLDYQNLARSIVGALLERPLEPLPPGERFEGGGVYAIYYAGDFEPYKPLSSTQPEKPIYVGCATTAGRKGRKGQNRYALFNRLGQHAHSIEVAENLDIEDFSCRYLTVLPIWVRLAERFLLEHFRPIWNVCVDGFGNHDPGKRRRTGARPQWDILHPGRHWAGEMPAAQSADSIRKAIRDELSR